MVEEENNENAYNLFDDIPDRLRVFKQSVNLQIHQDYLNWAASINPQGYEELDSQTKSSLLSDPSTSLAQKKTCLILLAREGAVKACLILDKYVETTTDAELKAWGILALEEGWMLVESREYDEPVGMIMSGLGGEAHRLRYFVAISFDQDDVTTDQNKLRLLEQGFRLACQTYDAILEETQIYPTYVTLQLLISLDIAVADVIERGIQESNETDIWLDIDYFVTNTEIPAPEMIVHYLHLAKQS